MDVKKIAIITVRTCLLVVLSVTAVVGQLRLSSVLCGNKINPLGVDLSNVYFSWELTSNENNQYQTAWQIAVASTKDNLQKGYFDIWNSGIVTSRQSLLLKYGGKQLRPAQTYYWQVKVWDKKRIASVWSNVQQFTTGIFSKNDWANAKWIGYEDMPDSMRVAPGIHGLETKMLAALGNKCMQRTAVPLLRKEFSIKKKVQSALLFITGLGQYEAAINGAKVGSSFLSPGWTYYDKTVLYNVYDVKDQVLAGENAIGVIVGNGFYNINRERYFKIVTAFGMPKMICRLKINYEDGEVENIISDESWKAAPSPVTFSSIYGGEDYDAQQEQPGWSNSSFNDAGWKQALQVKMPEGKLIAEQDYPVALLDSFAVKNIRQTKDGVYLYDFGQNISGIVRLMVKGKKGQVIKLVPAELINKDGSPNQTASGDPFSFSYTLRGNDEGEVWQPRFTYYGFRYVQVEGATPDTSGNLSGLPVIEKLTSLHNRNSNPVNGNFNCSNELFNRIYALVNWAIKSNLQSVVTDCPHREKLSWLEQDYLMGASIHYNHDIYGLYRKLVLDLIDAQYPKGFVPDIAPEFVVFADGFLDSPEWGSSAVIVPWLLYSWYGDEDIMKKAYPMMKKYAAYLETKTKDHVLSHGLGDWFDYGPKQPGEAQLTPKSITATSIYYYDVLLLGKMAAVLGHKQDAQAFRLKAAAIKKTFNYKFFQTSTNVYSTGSQTAMAMPYCVGLAEEGTKKRVLKNLVDSIIVNGKTLTAGDIGFHFLVKALDDGGASQLLFDMVNRSDVPGYGFQLAKGATALTESWPALENVSNNHLMLGHIMEWFYSGLAGIGQQEHSVAFRHIKIRPQPVGDIRFANGRFHSPYGWITSAWKKEAGKFILRIQLPVNTTATVYLPVSGTSKIYMNGKMVRNGRQAGNTSVASFETGSGEYQFEVD